MSSFFKKKTFDGTLNKGYVVPRVEFSSSARSACIGTKTPLPLCVKRVFPTQLVLRAKVEPLGTIEGLSDLPVDCGSFSPQWVCGALNMTYAGRGFFADEQWHMKGFGGVFFDGFFLFFFTNRVLRHHNFFQKHKEEGDFLSSHRGGYYKPGMDLSQCRPLCLVEDNTSAGLMLSPKKTPPGGLTVNKHSQDVTSLGKALETGGAHCFLQAQGMKGAYASCRWAPHETTDDYYVTFRFQRLVKGV